MLRLRNERGELVAINLELLIVPSLGAITFSVGALHEKGVKLDLLSVPPVLRYDNHAFQISTKDVCRAYSTGCARDYTKHIPHNSGRRHVAPKDRTLSPARIETAYDTYAKHVKNRSESDDQDEEGFEVLERHDFDWINLQRRRRKR